MDFDFDYELRGEKLIIVSFKYDNKNHFRKYFDKIQPSAKKTFINIVTLMKDEVGFNISNRRKFEWLKDYYKQGEIKTHDPGHRFSLTNYHYEKLFMILVLGFLKRGNKAQLHIRESYEKTDRFIKMMMEDENELRKKLRKFL